MKTQPFSLLPLVEGGAYEVFSKDISMLRVDGTPAGVFDGFFTGFCVCLVLLSGF